MKRGLLRAYNLDSNRGHPGLRKNVEIRNRKPSRLEERIRFRRQLSNNHKIVNNSINRNDTEEDAENSTLSRTSSDSSDNSIPKNRDSKQRVDLLDLEPASTPKPPMIEKSKTLFKERINSILANNHRPRIKPRAKSAPCTPLFQIKCPKGNFTDFLIKNTPEVEEEDQKPIGNQLLISVMKESIDEIKEDLNSKTEENRDLMIKKLKEEEEEEEEEEEPEVAVVAASESPQSLKIPEELKLDERRLGESQKLEELISKNDEETGGGKLANNKMDKSISEDLSIGEDKRPFHRPGDNCCIHRSNFNQQSKYCHESGKILRDSHNPGPKKCHEECKTGPLRASAEIDDLKISPGCKCSLKSCRRSLRSRSTPRRVTFCVPSLIPEEGNLSDAEVEKTTEAGGWKSSRCSCSRRCCEKFSKPVRQAGGNFFRYQGSIVGKFPFGGNLARDSASKTSMTDDIEWNVDWDEDRMHCVDGVSFPRETRLAMNVLMQSRDKSMTTRSISAGPRTQRCLHHPSREVKVLNKPDFGIFETAGEKAMHVATYAQALAVFQRTCDPLPDGRCKKKRHSTSKGGAYHNRCN